MVKDDDDNEIDDDNSKKFPQIIQKYAGWETILALHPQPQTSQ